MRPIAFAVPPCQCLKPLISRSSLWSMASNCANNKTRNPILVLIRHGETDWNRDGRAQGQLDNSRLTSHGAEQAQEAALALRNLKGVDQLLSSPLGRAMDTTKLLVKHSANDSLKDLKVEELSCLKEIWLPWQGLLKAEAKKAFSEYDQFWKDCDVNYEWDGNSPIGDLKDRARQFLKSARHYSEGKGGLTIAVAHNQMNRMILLEVLGCRDMPLGVLRQGNCCYNVIELADMPVLHLINYPALPTWRPCYKNDKDSIRLIMVAASSADECTEVLDELFAASEDEFGVEKLILAPANSPKAPSRALKSCAKSIEYSAQLEDLEDQVNNKCFREAILCGRSFLQSLPSIVGKGDTCVIAADPSALRALICAGLGAPECAARRLSFSSGGISVMHIAISNDNNQSGSIQTHLEIHNTSVRKIDRDLLPRRIDDIWSQK